MVPFEALRALKRKAALACALAAFAAPSVAATLDEAAYEERQRQILEQLRVIEARDGPYASALLEGLMPLILLYRENEDHLLAIAMIERALQVVRANSGLHSLEQVPLLWQRIFSEEARGNHAEVWELEQELLTLIRRYPDDLRAVPVLRDMAQRQMAVLERVVGSNEVPPQVIYGCFYQVWPNMDVGSCHAGSRKTVVQGMLAEANRNHADAIAILLRNEAYASAELHELELELVRGAELLRSEYERESVTGSRTRKVDGVALAPYGKIAELVEPWRSRTASIVELADWALPYDGLAAPEEDFLRAPEPREERVRSPYQRGRQSLRRLHAYEAMGSSVLARANALVQIADWDLLFSNNGLALEGYTLAYGMLEEANADEASIEQLLAPPLPVVLPSFEPNPLARDETSAATGYIDVAFAVTKYGRASDVEIHGAANADQSARRELVALLRSSRFRPRLHEGRFADSEQVVVRYYVH